MPQVIARAVQWGVPVLATWIAAKLATDVTGEVVEQSQQAADAAETASEAGLNIGLAALMGVAAFAALQAIKD